MITKLLDSQRSFSKVWKSAVWQRFCVIVSNIICRPLREHILFAYRRISLQTWEIGNCMKCFLPPLLPAVSKIQVQTVRRSVDRSQCFGGHQVSKTATLTSLARETGCFAPRSVSPQVQVIWPQVKVVSPQLKVVFAPTLKLFCLK